MSRLIPVAMIVLAFMVSSCAAAPYDATVDSVAYKVVLWKNGNPDSAKTVVGLYKDLKSGVGVHAECTVKAMQAKKADGTHWTIDVTPKGDWGVAEVRYPMLFLPKLQNDYVISAQRIGQRIPMSYYVGKRAKDKLPAFANRYEMNGYPELRNKLVFRSDRYPTKAVLQLIMYENDKQGVMIWTPDAEQRVKDFNLSREDLDKAHVGNGIRAYVSQYPDNTGQKGTAYKSAFPVVTTPYKNGWYNAALVYRDWGLKQKWCQKGKIYDRADTAEWVKDMHAFWGCAGRPGWVAQNIRGARAVVDGRTFGTQMMNWSQVFQANMVSGIQYMPAYNEPGLIKNINLKKRGLHIGPYFMFSGIVPYNKPVYEKCKSAIIKFPNGKPSIHYWGSININALRTKNPKELTPDFAAMMNSFLKLQDDLRKAWEGKVDEKLISHLADFPMRPVILKAQQNLLRKQWGKDAKVIDKLKIYAEHHRVCIAEKKFQKYCADMVSEAITRYGLTAVYFDTFPHSILPCYDKSHGHPLGYGKYLTEGARELLLELKKRHPHIMFYCESGAAETMADIASVTYFKGIKPAMAIPLYPTVYNGYNIWTQWWMFPPYKTHESYTSNLARGTHLGYVPGGAVHGLISQLYRFMKVPFDDPKVLYFQACIDIRSKWRDYIGAGWRLYDPKVKGAQPKAALWSTKDGKYQFPVRFTPIMASLWAHSKDTKKGLLLLSNWTGEKQTATIMGQTVTMTPYEWRGIEMPIAGVNMNATGATTGTAAGPSSGNDKGTLITGKIIRVDAAKSIVDVERIELKDGKAQTVRLSFVVNSKTQYRNKKALKDFWIGDNIELLYENIGGGVIRVIRITFDPKGDKEEEG
jgi:hypothetical protein